jgi:hypothetical protein
MATGRIESLSKSEGICVCCKADCAVKRALPRSHKATKYRYKEPCALVVKRAFCIGHKVVMVGFYPKGLSGAIRLGNDKTKDKKQKRKN